MPTILRLHVRMKKMTRPAAFAIHIHRHMHSYGQTAREFIKSWIPGLPVQLCNSPVIFSQRSALKPTSACNELTRQKFKWDERRLSWHECTIFNQSAWLSKTKGYLRTVAGTNIGQSSTYQVFFPTRSITAIHSHNACQDSQALARCTGKAGIKANQSLQF